MRIERNREEARKDEGTRKNLLLHRTPDHTGQGHPTAEGGVGANGHGTQFVTGGALGFDTLAAEEVLCQRKTHPNIRLHLMMPCKGQEKKWRLGDRMRYQRITRQADEVTCLAEEYYDGCMLKRNREMINISAHCVVYCTKPKGGTVYTANRAEQAGLHMIYLMQR